MANKAGKVVLGLDSLDDRSLASGVLKIDWLFRIGIDASGWAVGSNFLLVISSAA